MLVGKDVSPMSDGEFRSNLDLQAILVSYVNGPLLTSPRNEIQVVGSTDRWVYGKITVDRQHLSIATPLVHCCPYMEILFNLTQR